METNIQQGQALEQQATVTTKAPRKRKYLIILSVLVLFLVLLYFIYPVLLSIFFGRDIPAQAYSDLQIDTRVIPENENAYYDLVKLSEAKTIYEPPFVMDYLAGKAAWDPAAVADTWYKNQDLFPIFYAATSKDKFQDPNTDQPEDLAKDELLLSENAWRSMSRLSVIRAYYFLENKQSKEAMDEALKSVKLGSMIQQSQLNLITFLVGTAIENNGLQALEKIKPSLSTDDKTFLSSELGRYVDNTAGFISANKIEFLREAKIIADISLGVSNEYVSDDNKEFGKLTKNNFYFKPNLTISYYADLTREEISKVSDCANAKDEQKPLRFPDIGGNSIKMKFTENAVGKTVYSVSDVGLGSTRLKLCDQRALVQKLIQP